MRNVLAVSLSAALAVTYAAGVTYLVFREDSSEPSAVDARVSAAILALAEDNVKLREAYASCSRSRSGLEETLRKERAK